MIIKVSKGRGNGSKVGSFGALAKYLEKDPEKNERVLFSHTTNVHSEDIAGAALEIEATQKRNHRLSKNPNYHIIASFAPGEKVSIENMKKMEQQIVDSLGFSEHQRVMVVHTDTDSLHFHIAINRVHPKTLKVHNPYNDMLKLQEVAAKIEIDYGLVQLNHTRAKSVGQGKAMDMQEHRGQESMITYAKSISSELKQSKDWKTFHSVLEKNGLRIEEKGQGYVIGNGETFIKASSIDRELSKKYLNERFGEFQPNQSSAKEPTQKYEAKPIENFDRDAHEQEFWKKADAAYKEIIKTDYVHPSRQAQLRDEWKRAQDKLIKEKNPETEAIKAKYQKYREQAAKELKSDRQEVYKSWKPGKSKAVTKAQYQALSEIYKAKLENYRVHQKKELDAVLGSKKESWKDHCHRLAKSGSKEHLVILRSLEKHQKLKENILSGHNAVELPWAYSHITKGGIVRYQSKHGVVQDEGRRVSIGKTNMQSVALIVDVAIYKFGLKQGSQIKIDESSSKAFKMLVVSYAKANKLESKIENFESLDKLYGKAPLVKVYKDKIINKIAHKLGVSPDQFRPKIPVSQHSERVQIEVEKAKTLSQGRPKSQDKGRSR